LKFLDNFFFFQARATLGQVSHVDEAGNDNLGTKVYLGLEKKSVQTSFWEMITVVLGVGTWHKIGLSCGAS